MSIRPISENISPVVEAAYAAGLTVHVPPPLKSRQGLPATFVYITRPDLPGTMMVQNSSSPVFEPANLTAPVAPSKVYGNAVLVDYDGTPADAVAAILRVLEAGEIRVRFMKDAPIVPTERRIPETATVWAP